MEKNTCNLFLNEYTVYIDIHSIHTGRQVNLSLKHLRALVVGQLRLFMFGYASSALFYCVYGVVFAIFFYNSYFRDEDLIILADLVMVAMVQIVGLGFNKYNLVNPFRSDPYTRLVRVMRTLPIRTEYLAAARLIPIFILSAVNLFMLYVPAYGIYSNINEAITFPELIGYLFFLYLASVVFACIYAYLEVGFGGRVYFFVSLIMLLCTSVVTIYLTISGFRISERLMQQVQEGISPLVYGASALVAAFVVYMIWRLTTQRLAHREYYDYKAVS